MRYLIDANLPRYFSLWSSTDYEFVVDIEPTWKDSNIWDYAKANQYTIVSKDADFSNRALLNRDAPRIIHIRFGNLRMNEFHQRLSEIWEEVCVLSKDFRLVQIYRDRIESIE